MSNRVHASLLLAFVLGAATCSLAQEDTKEIGLLLGNEKVFAPFCLNARDEIYNDIVHQTNSKTSEVYGIFFGAATEIADDVLSVERKAVEEFANELKQTSEIADANEPLPEDEIQRKIEEGKRAIRQKSSLLGRFIAAGQSVAGSVLYNAANSAIFVRLAKARSFMTKDNLLYGIIATCNRVAEYERKLELDLEAVKEELASEHADNLELKQTIESMSVLKLKCYTTKYISRLNGFCEILQKGASALMKMLGLGSDYKLPTGITSSSSNSTTQ